MSAKKHPEQPPRVSSILEALQGDPSLELINIEEYGGALTTEEIEKLASELQGANYVEFIKEMWDPDSKRSEMYINKDTYYCKNTYQAALASATTAITAIDYVLSNKDTTSFAVVRPPGHHSGQKSQPHGFSFLNNIALVAHYVTKTKKHQESP